MIKKGSCDSNVANEGVIGTLIIQSEDLVQVVAKVTTHLSFLHLLCFINFITSKYNSIKPVPHCLEGELKAFLM